jgi:hypothetical protein
MEKSKAELVQRTVYKVWIEIEEFDESTGDGTTVDTPGAALQQFESYKQAYEYACKITTLFGS